MMQQLVMCNDKTRAAMRTGLPCAAAQVIKLPAGKYTVREREMLSGVAGAPESYFMPGNAFSNSIIVGEHPYFRMLC